MTKDSGTRTGSTTRLAVAALATVALFAVLVVPLPMMVYQSRLLGAIENAVHGPLFAAVGCLAVWLLGGASWRNYLAAWLIVAGLAAGTEIAQGLGSRDPSWGDVRTDLLGATAGLALWAAYARGRAKLSRLQRAALLGVASLAAVLICIPLIRPVSNWFERSQRMPVLFSAEFRAAPDMTESMTENEDVTVAVRNGVLQVDLLAGSLPGVVVTDFTPDWRGHQALLVDIENPRAVPLSIEVHLRDFGSSDAETDRFNARRTLLPGQRAPLLFDLSDVATGPWGRRMKLEAMMVIAIYRIEHGSDRFILHSVRLE